jgi:glycosyltransferase involved in cell wall biosynthesis
VGGPRRRRGGSAGARHHYLIVEVAFHVDQLWFAAPGGIGTYVRRLPEAMRAEDPNVSLLFFRSRWPSSPSGTSPVPYAIELPWTIRTLYPSWALLGRPALPEPLGRVDVVHATNPAAVPPAPGGAKLVVTVHDLAFEKFPDAFDAKWRWLYRAGLAAAIARADALIVPSESTAADLRGRGADAEKIHVVPLAGSEGSQDADPAEVVARLRVPVPFILNVGTIEPRKNLVRLVRAYRRVIERTGLPHALVLCGPNGWGEDDLLHELAAGGAGRIVRTGRLDPPDVDALYRSADAMAYPSLYEGFGLPVVEALSRGVPTLTSSASSMPEVAGDAALLVDPVDEKALATALERLLTDEVLAAKLREAGPVQAARFSWSRTARATLDVYESVMGGA